MLSGKVSLKIDKRKGTRKINLCKESPSNQHLGSESRYKQRILQLSQCI